MVFARTDSKHTTIRMESQQPPQDWNEIMHGADFWSRAQEHLIEEVTF